MGTHDERVQSDRVWRKTHRVIEIGGSCVVSAIYTSSRNISVNSERMIL